MQAIFQRPVFVVKRKAVLDRKMKKDKIYQRLQRSISRGHRRVGEFTDRSP